MNEIDIGGGRSFRQMTSANGIDAPQQTTKAGNGAATNKPPGIRRLQWLAEINISRKYSPTTLAVAGALAWSFTDKRTAVTKVKIETVAAFLDCTKRAVTKAFAELHADGWLTVVARSTRKGEATSRRLSLPAETRSAPPNGAAADGERRPSKRTWGWDEHEAHMVAWLNAETDPTAMKNRWNSAEETKLRKAACADDPEYLAEECEDYLQRRLNGEKLRVISGDDDEAPF